MIIIREENSRLCGVLKVQSPNFKSLGSSIIIDTGCQGTRINYDDFMKGSSTVRRILAREQKKKDIKEFKEGNLEVTVSKGANDNIRLVKKKLISWTDKALLDANNVGFIHEFNDFCVNGVSLGKRKVRVFYNGAASLLGMDILKDFYWRFEDGLFLMDSKSLDIPKNEIQGISECKNLVKTLLNQKKSLKEVRAEVEKEYPGLPIEAIMFDLLENTYLVSDEGEV